jgi:hypothetical protein
MPLEVGHKPHAIEADEQPVDTGLYQKAVGSILYAALSSQPDITYAITASGRYAAQTCTLNRVVIQHMFRSHCGTSEYKLTIYDPRLQHVSNAIVCYTNADLEGEVNS